jgi:upstream activation factor subunit UAF30
MPKSKQTTKATDATPAPKQAAAPAKKVVKSTKTAAPVAAVSATPAPVESVEVKDASIDVEASLMEASNEFLAKLQQINNVITSLKSEYRTLEKKWMRELKTALKSSSKRKRRAGNRAPSGFVKPTRISDELAKFLDKPTGSEMARTEVTRDINKYIRTHNLQDKDNGRKINPDSKLSALLKLKGDDELTYFNLQKFMSPHFAKATKTEAST